MVVAIELSLYQQYSKNNKGGSPSVSGFMTLAVRKPMTDTLGCSPYFTIAVVHLEDISRPTVQTCCCINTRNNTNRKRRYRPAVRLSCTSVCAAAISSKTSWTLQPSAQDCVSTETFCHSITNLYF